MCKRVYSHSTQTFFQKKNFHPPCRQQAECLAQQFILSLLWQIPEMVIWWLIKESKHSEKCQVVHRTNANRLITMQEIRWSRPHPSGGHFVSTFRNPLLPYLCIYLESNVKCKKEKTKTHFSNSKTYGWLGERKMKNFDHFQA